MNFCGFCGKGLFPLSTTLNKHIQHSVNCNKVAQKKWGSYATNVWKNNAPGPSNLEQHPPASPPILGDDEIPNMLDITLEDDLRMTLPTPGVPSQITDLKMRYALIDLGISI